MYLEKVIRKKTPKTYFVGILKAMDEKSRIRIRNPVNGSKTMILGGQNYLAGVDSNVDGGSISLLTLDPLDVDSQLGSVALDNLADLENISHLKIQRAPSK
jgi:hypothetical protein